MKDFSAAARAELARVNANDTCCMRAELGGALRAAGSLHLHGQRQVSFSIQTEHADVARKVVRLLRRVAGLPAEVVVEDREQLRKRRVYRVQSAPGTGARKLLAELGILNESGDLGSGVPPELVRRECCRAAFLRGAYLLCGSVCDPHGSSYHLEMVVNTEEFALGLLYLLNLAHFKAHQAARKGKQVVYLKDADRIAGFLRTIGAHAALLAMEEVRVVKEVRGEVNRLVNADTANVNKSVRAALEQIRAIEEIGSSLGLGRLPAPLRQLAAARLEHPEASLAELGHYLPEPASKSAVNHRMRKLMAIWKEIAKRD